MEADPERVTSSVTDQVSQSWAVNLALKCELDGTYPFLPQFTLCPTQLHFSIYIQGAAPPEFWWTSLLEGILEEGLTTSPTVAAGLQAIIHTLSPSLTIHWFLLPFKATSAGLASLLGGVTQTLRGLHDYLFRVCQNLYSQLAKGCQDVPKWITLDSTHVVPCLLFPPNIQC